MSTDPLWLVTPAKWSDLKEVFKSDWPRSIAGYTVLDTQERIINLGLDYGFKVYCPFGDINNGIVAINIKQQFYELIIQYPKDDTKELEEAIKNTKIIDWTRQIDFAFTSKHVVECIKKVIAEKNYKIGHLTTTETFILDEAKPLFDVSLPSGLSFDLLSLENIPLIDTTWPHRYPGSQWYHELIIKAKLGYGLFNGKELLAWVYVKEMGALGHLYTVENHRRKGYGEIVLKMMSNVLKKDGKCVYAYCVLGNTSAYKLYVKLGFRSVYDVDWGSLIHI